MFNYDVRREKNGAKIAINIMIQLIIPIMGFIAGKPVSWIMIAPSVTPRKSGIGSNNPAMRLYKFDTDTGQVSWKCFRHNITTGNK